MLQLKQTAVSACRWSSICNLQWNSYMEFKPKMDKLKSHLTKCCTHVRHLLGKKQILWSSLLGCHLTIHVRPDQIVHTADPLLQIWDLEQWSELCFLPSAPEDKTVIKSNNNNNHAIYYAILSIDTVNLHEDSIHLKQEKHHTLHLEDG